MIDNKIPATTPKITTYRKFFLYISKIKLINITLMAIGMNDREVVIIGFDSYGIQTKPKSSTKNYSRFKISNSV